MHVHTSVGEQVFNFGNTHQLRVFLKIQKEWTTRSRYLKQKRVQVQRIANSRYFKKLKESSSFMKELTKTQQYLIFDNQCHAQMKASYMMANYGHANHAF